MELQGAAMHLHDSILDVNGLSPKEQIEGNDKLELKPCLLLLLLFLHSGTLPCTDFLVSLRLAWLLLDLGCLATLRRCCRLVHCILLNGTGIHALQWHLCLAKMQQGLILPTKKAC